MKRIQRILHPSDFSPASAPAFTTATEMAKSRRAELILVHVLSPVVPVVGDGYISPKAYDDLVRSTRAAGQKQLDSLLARARKAGVRGRALLLEGVTHDQIGRGGMAKLFLGSVAERVIGSARCPVLTVRKR